MNNDVTRNQISRDLARLMLVMRRFIKEEFSVTIHLDEPEAADELLAFAARSGNGMLHEMAKELEYLVAPEDDAAGDKAEKSPAPSSTTTYYRGAPVHQQAEVKETAEPVSASAKRIYRGRLVG